jgi:starch synthase
MVMPFYRSIKEKGLVNRRLPKTLEVPLGGTFLRAGVLESEIAGGIPIYFIEREDFYDRPNLYGNKDGDYYDNLERFTFFSHAALLLAKALFFEPHIIHCHDWQCGLVPALLKGTYQKNASLARTATVFTVHNIGYRGIFPPHKFSLTGLSATEFFHMEGMEFWGNMSLLKAGLVYADAITTVSPSHAQEMQTSQFGQGMEGVLTSRKSSLHGILNGADYEYWNPRLDPLIPAHYSSRDMSGKKRCKKTLLKEMGLSSSLEKRPLLAMITRLDNQKGLDLALAILQPLFRQEVGLVILGSGDGALEEDLLKAADLHKGKMRVHIGFDEPLAHRIMAGSDMFLIPSRYEPCGLTQMYAMKYGTVPIVRAIGGLKDTVHEFDSKSGKGTGFTFQPFERNALLAAIKAAVDCYGERKLWKKLMENGMETNFSWDLAARRYIELFRSMIKATRPHEVSAERPDNRTFETLAL